MHRFYVDPTALPAEAGSLPEEVAHQVARVLRLRAGDRVVLFCGDGHEHPAVLEAVGPKGASVRLEGRRTPRVELPVPLAVAVAVLKGEKLEWVVQKLTELGAARILLVLTERTVVAAGEERWPKRLERYRRIAREAAEQSGRVRLPEVVEPRPLDAVLAAEAGSLRLILDPLSAVPLRHALGEPQPVTLFIGPEGGFSPAEAARAREGGAQPVSLGRRILRAETAALAAAALAAEVLEVSRKDAKTQRGRDESADYADRAD